ncbi:calcium/sodium antiporter [Candidatus Woesearchaeota archaeon]|nr:calcium/sodium antiporter [Candidatus Woesearchaeota archaeon]
MYTETGNLIISLIWVWLSANIIVEYARKIARAFNVSDAFIGLTVLSIGTSLPEIFTHIISSINILNGIESSGVAVGTNIGSNIIQITLILGVIALLTKVKTDKKILKMDYPIMLGSILLVFIFSLNGFIGHIEGFFLVSAYIIFLVWLSHKEKLIDKNPQKLELFHFLSLIVGFALLITSTKSVVNSALSLSHIWGVSESLIGVLIIGAATALPELTTALIALFRGSTSMSLGTLIGSNITNPLFALGIGAIISGYTIDASILWYDLPFWFFISLLAMLFFKRKMLLEKKEAITLIMFYIAYAILRIKYLAHI